VVYQKVRGFASLRFGSGKDGRMVGRIVSDTMERGSAAAKYRQARRRSRLRKSYLKVVLIDVGGTRVKRHT